MAIEGFKRAAMKGGERCPRKITQFREFLPVIQASLGVL
jgi:hypothetical protein